jgi:hypothetical protein
LPERVWLTVFQNLEVEDVNNLHLVNRNLHQRANLHVHQRLRIDDQNYPEILESLVQSSRVFEELEFWQGKGDDQVLSPAIFEIIEQYIKFTGIHVKKLFVNIEEMGIQMDRKVVQKMLAMLPNLETLELDEVAGEEVKWDIKSMKIERLKLGGIWTGFDSLLETLEK